MIDIETIRKELEGHSMVKEIDQVRKGHVRIETAFQYPEGSSVDLFVVDEDLLPPSKLSDLGATSQWLLDMQVRPWLSKKRQDYIDDALRIYGVKQDGGALELGLESLGDIKSGIIHLGQACVRVSDLIYTGRARQEQP